MSNSESSGIKIYRMGRKLSILQYLAVLIIAVISFMFYFIYDFLFSTAAPWLGGGTLGLIFLIVDLLLVALDCYLIKKVRAGVFYRVTSDCLEYSMFGRSAKYYWSQFSDARFGRVTPGMTCPVTFIIQGKELRLNQYVEQAWMLAKDILAHISPYAQIEPGLSDKVDSMADF